MERWPFYDVTSSNAQPWGKTFSLLLRAALKKNVPVGRDQIWILVDLSKLGLVNIYGLVLKLAAVLLLSQSQIVYDPVSGWVRIF